MLKRNDKVIAIVSESVSKDTIQDLIRDNIEIDSQDIHR